VTAMMSVPGADGSAGESGKSLPQLTTRVPRRRATCSELLAARLASASSCDSLLERPYKCTSKGQLPVKKQASAEPLTSHDAILHAGLRYFDRPRLLPPGEEESPKVAFGLSPGGARRSETTWLVSGTSFVTPVAAGATHSAVKAAIPRPEKALTII
jgi:hypothetical protein